MIHTLQVHPSMSPEKLKKLARRYAMTGGFELELAPELTQPELTKLVSVYLPIAQENRGQGLKYRASNAFRILKLVLASGELDENTRSDLEQSAPELFSS